MLFNSLIFTVFLPLVFTVYWLCPPAYRKYWLLAASYYFYFSYNPWFVLLLAGTSCVDYWCARNIASMPARKKSWLWLSLLSNLGVLFAFKYAVFFYNTAISLSGAEAQLLQNIIVPAGLSFYTFQSLSYTIDVYRGKYPPRDSFADFLLYVSFFPHMVAGPVVRYQSLMPQLQAVSFFKQINWGLFARLTIWGYFKKLVIADNLNLIVSPVFDHPAGYSGVELMLAGVLFMIQVYCDFSGYSDIATGVARLFNIELSLNWRRPFFSKSLREFWQRNHISITTWFRDYLYISLGGNRLGYKRWLLNIFLVFVISGFWHGASFTFVIWGAMHGVVYILELLMNKKYPHWKSPAVLAHIYLLTFHAISLIAFRANSTGDLWLIYQRITGFNCGPSGLSQVAALQDRFFMLACLFFMALLALKEAHEEFAWLNRQPKIYAPAREVFYIVAVVLIFVAGNFSANAFIYFQF